MAGVTVRVTSVNGGYDYDMKHDNATEFAAVQVERVGSVLEVYDTNGKQIAAYAPGCWVSAAIT